MGVMLCVGFGFAGGFVVGFGAVVERGFVVGFGVVVERSFVVSLGVVVQGLFGVVVRPVVGFGEIDAVAFAMVSSLVAAMDGLGVDFGLGVRFGVEKGRGRTCRAVFVDRDRNDCDIFLPYTVCCQPKQTASARSALGSTY